MDKKPTRCHFCVILYFSFTSCSICFGQPCAHLQELTYPPTHPILALTGPVVLRTPQWTHYLLTGSDSLPAATGMYFNLLTHRTTPTHNNENTTHNTPHNHTQPAHTRFIINQTNIEHIDPHR